MRRSPAVISALSVFALSLVTGSQALAAGPSTTLSVNLMNAAGNAPMEDAHVVVYLLHRVRDLAAARVWLHPVGAGSFRGHRFRRQPPENTKAQGGWQAEENGIGIDFTLGGDKQFTGGSMSLMDLMTYASITSVTWSYVKGCGRRHTRVIYGYHTDPVAAGRVLAACELNSKLR